MEDGSAEKRFCVIGAQKAGTTWLYHMLSRHPRIYVPGIKEINYYFAVQEGRTEREIANFEKARESLASRLNGSDASGDEDAEETPAGLQRKLEEMDVLLAALRGQRPLTDLFAMRSGSFAAYGDVTPANALLNADSYKKILDENPETRFVFIMRDPVERVLSSAKMGMRRKDRAEKELGDLDKYVNTFTNMRTTLGRMTDYKRTIETLEAAVPKEQVLYLFYENLFSDRMNVELKKLARHLGVVKIPGDREKRVNTAREGQSSSELLAAGREERIVQRLRPQYRFVRTHLRRQVPDEWRKPGPAPAGTGPKARAKLKEKVA